jgi:hypothetical protein
MDIELRIKMDFPSGPRAGFEWRRQISRDTRVAVYCDWETIEPGEASWIVRMNPHFHVLVDFNEFRGYDWCTVLTTRPQFGSVCDWGKLEGEDISWLLRSSPMFAIIIEDDIMDGDDVDWVLREVRHLEPIIGDIEYFFSKNRNMVGTK